MLTTQFMAGLRDRRIHQQLAPMRPRSMKFKDLRQELRVIAEERITEEEVLRRQVNLMAQIPEKSSDHKSHPEAKN